MDLTIKSLMEWTKLTVRDPATASSLVKESKLSIEASVLLIVLVGVVSGVVSGLVEFLIGPQAIDLDLGNGQSLVFKIGPIAEGFYASVIGLAFAYAIYLIGRWMGGQGSLAEVFSVVAVLQLVMTVIMVGQLVIGILVPILGLFVMLIGLYVFVRGLGHAVKVGHGFESMGKSAGVIVLSFFASLLAVSFIFAITGLGPQGVIEGTAL